MSEINNKRGEKLSLTVQGKFSEKFTPVQYARLIDDLKVLSDKYYITVSVDTAI
ncbi:hypothetical protein [Leuconostoc gelidum]|mgnify:CR=1 FL=1|uniref:hypothetical protein n=1 Tax=Leuconostoc gelidum TaxID=1244 RepID=UPI001CC4F591|nr:hypothetical protein [Leuconostoc gelidum]MBZ5991463.1 hypothetical protein [Leuconostoc gelidum subsp. gelidum]